ncbi:hypothetical protein HDU82_002979 [Entophlyctis luteolus]|nr:hypothetical protein HDU82_002979 [Entophlyctis luteolus]
MPEDVAGVAADIAAPAPAAAAVTEAASETVAAAVEVATAAAEQTTVAVAGETLETTDSAAAATVTAVEEIQAVAAPAKPKFKLAPLFQSKRRSVLPASSTAEVVPDDAAATVAESAEPGVATKETGRSSKLSSGLGFLWSGKLNKTKTDAVSAAPVVEETTISAETEVAENAEVVQSEVVEAASTVVESEVVVAAPEETAVTTEVTETVAVVAETTENEVVTTEAEIVPPAAELAAEPAVEEKQPVPAPSKKESVFASFASTLKKNLSLRKPTATAPQAAETAATASSAIPEAEETVETTVVETTVVSDVVETIVVSDDVKAEGVEEVSEIVVAEQATAVVVETEVAEISAKSLDAEVVELPPNDAPLEEAPVTTAVEESASVPPAARKIPFDFSKFTKTLTLRRTKSTPPPEGLAPVVTETAEVEATEAFVETSEEQAETEKPAHAPSARKNPFTSLSSLAKLTKANRRKSAPIPSLAADAVVSDSEDAPPLSATSADEAAAVDAPAVATEKETPVKKFANALNNQFLKFKKPWAPAKPQTSDKVPEVVVENVTEEVSTETVTATAAEGTKETVTTTEVVTTVVEVAAETDVAAAS